MNDDMYEYFNDTHLKFQCEFRKGYEMRKIVVTIRPKLCGNCAFLQNFRTRKLGEITIFFAVS